MFIPPEWELSFFQTKVNSTYCAADSPSSVMFWGPLCYLLELRQHLAQSHKFGVTWPAFSSRVSWWTAFILIAPDKCFPWHTISPSSHLFVLFHMPKHFNDIGFQAFSGLAELMKQGSYRAEQSADLFFFSRRQNKARRERKATERED